MTMKWEYRVVREGDIVEQKNRWRRMAGDHDQQAIEYLLNELGQEGWELVASQPQTKGHHRLFILKRQVE